MKLNKHIEHNYFWSTLTGQNSSLGKTQRKFYSERISEISFTHFSLFPTLTKFHKIITATIYLEKHAKEQLYVLYLLYGTVASLL